MEWALLLLLLLLAERRDMSVVNRRSLNYRERHAALTRAAAKGEKWRAALAATRPAKYSDPAWLDGLVRWIGMESGGDPSTRTRVGEVGLTQVMSRYASEYGFSPADLEAYSDPSTPPEILAGLAWRHLAALDRGAPSLWPARERAWRVMVRHGLPAIYNSLVDQGFITLATPGPGGPLDSAPDEWDPPAKLHRYAWGRDPRWGLLVRFITPADVVADFDRKSWHRRGEA